MTFKSAGVRAVDNQTFIVEGDLTSKATTKGSFSSLLKLSKGNEGVLRGKKDIKVD